MSVLGKILGGIFKRKPQAAPTSGSASAPQPQTQTDAPAKPASPAPAEPVDIEAVLTEMAAKSGQTLNWRTSIVDLMKLVGLESSLAERRELADELGYTGDKSDTASMNIWLHKQVMNKLAENGGRVPDDLR